MRLIESLGDGSDLVEIDGRSFPATCLVEDDDGIRIFITTPLAIGADVVSVPAEKWARAHSAGARVLAGPIEGGPGWWVATVEEFMDGREEHPRSRTYGLAYEYLGEYDRLPTYREMVEQARQDSEAQREVAVAGSTAITGFVHLHTHAEYSPLDGMSTAAEIVREVVRHGQAAVAVTDHGGCPGHPALQIECDKAGIKPIFGIEANLVDDRFRRGDPEVAGDAKRVLADYSHLVLLAMSDKGLRNIWGATTESNRDGFYQRPRMDWDTLERFSEDVIATTGCLRGPVARKILDNDEVGARTALARLMGIYGDRLYVEIHTNSLPEQRRVNEALIGMAREYRLPLVAAVDSHYPTAKDKRPHAVWIASQTDKDLTDDADLFAGDCDYHVMSEEEVRASLAYLGPHVVDEAVENTARIANLCTAQVKGETSAPVFSKVKVAPGATRQERKEARAAAQQRDVERLVELALSNFAKRCTGPDKSHPIEDYEARFEQEMRLLIDKGFCFTAGTRVTMADGSLKPVEEIRVDDTVVTRIGTGRVAKTLVRTPDETVRITVAGSAWDLHTTPDHPILVQDRDWTEAGRVQTGDYVGLGLAPERPAGQGFDLLGLALAKGWSVEREAGRFRRLGPGRWGTDLAKTGWCPEEIVLNADWGYLLGLWVAEGHLETGQNAGQVGWTLCSGEDAVEQLVATLSRLGLGEARVYSKATPRIPDHRGVSVKVTNHPLWLLLNELIGTGVRAKRLHPWLATAPASETYALVEGWFDGDGTTKPSGRRVVDTVNPVLARQLRQALLRQGHWATTTRFLRPTDGVESYRVNWTPQRTKAPYGARFDEGRWWARVRSVVQAPGEKVYNLTIDGDPSYVAEDVVTHNCGYYLMVSDYCRHAREHGILVGPGRGSGSGSLVAYLVDITGIDPVETGLMFERFLTPGRTSLPDFDVDFPSSKRKELTDYIVEKYGRENVVRVGTHVRLKSKGVVRDMARVLKGTIENLHYPDIDAVSSLIEVAEADTAGLGMSWDALWDEHGEVLGPYREKYPLLFEYADRLVGRLKSYGRHPAGVVIAPDADLAASFPMRLAGDDLVLEFSMDDAEKLGLVKFDLLTLRTLDTIQQAVDNIRETRDVQVNVYDWDEEYLDPQVWDEISDGHTLGIFQIETPGGTRDTKVFRPQSIDELADLITLVRPGPKNSGLTETYRRRKFGEEDVTFLDPRLEQVLASTQGAMIYQEQVINTCRVLGGYTSEEADEVRRLLGKKKVEQVAAAGEKFRRMCAEHDTDPHVADVIWDQMAEFAKYSFNRSHAYGYSILGYWTAWLKFHYPVQFLTAVLSTVKKDRIPQFVNEARRMGYRVLPPDINVSGFGFRAGQMEVRYGFDSVKGCGDAVVEAILKGQPYKDFDDFLARKGEKCNVGHIKTLAAVGAFDSIFPNRKLLERRIAWDTDGSADRCQHKDESVLKPHGLPCTFDWDSEPVPLGKRGQELKRKPLPRRCTKACRQWTAPVFDPTEMLPYTDDEIMAREMELLGVHLSATPFDRIPDDVLEQMDTGQDVETGPPGEYVVPAIVSRVKPHVSKNGKEMGFVGVYALDADLDVTVFSDQWRSYRGDLRKGLLCFLMVRKNDRGLTLTALQPI